MYVFVGENDFVRNIKVIKNGELLYDLQRIFVCLVFIKNEIFFIGIVSVVMKNKVSCLYIYVYVVLVRDLINVCNILSFDINFFLF